jgi:HEAT repeat protein
MSFRIEELHSPKAPLAAQYYLERGNEAIPDLAAALKSNSDGVITAAAALLAKIGGEPALKALRDAYEAYNKAKIKGVDDNRVNNANHDNCEAFIKAGLTMAYKTEEAHRSNAIRAQSWLNHVARTVVWADLKILAASGRAAVIGPRGDTPGLVTPAR